MTGPFLTGAPIRPLAQPAAEPEISFRGRDHFGEEMSLS